jgi:hypothetical protein
MERNNNSWARENLLILPAISRRILALVYGGRFLRVWERKP